jgi:hypothetical protein
VLVGAIATATKKPTGFVIQGGNFTRIYILSKAFGRLSGPAGGLVEGDNSNPDHFLTAFELLADARREIETDAAAGWRRTTQARTKLGLNHASCPRCPNEQQRAVAKQQRQPLGWPEADSDLETANRARGVRSDSNWREITVVHGHTMLALTCGRPGQACLARNLCRQGVEGGKSRRCDRERIIACSI